MKMVKTILLLLTLLPLTACGIAGAPIDGKVVEAGTLKPIPGAIVIARWQGIMPAPGHGVHSCIHVETTTTNDKGEFHIPLWVGVPKYIAEVETSIDAYKSGYGFPEMPSQKDEVVWMIPFKGSAKERLEFLLRMENGNRCTSAGTSLKKLYPFLKALYEEAKKIATTREEKVLAEYLNDYEDILTFDPNTPARVKTK